VTRRTLLAGLSAAHFAQHVTNSLLSALLPFIRDTFALSNTQAGFAVTAYTIASGVTNAPFGLLADRVGARSVTIASAGLFTLATLGQGLADAFWSLVLARVAFGVAFGALWTAGLAWLADSTPARPRASALGATVTVTGVGFTIGPAFAGLLADRFGPGVPFLSVAAVAAGVTAALVLGGPPVHFEVERRPLLATLRGARADELVLGGLIVTALIGFVAGGVNLLVPLQLRENGVSAGEIGLLLSSASVIYTLVSGFVARLGSSARAAGPRACRTSTVARRRAKSRERRQQARSWRGV
jgi:MFS family permease